MITLSRLVLVLAPVLALIVACSSTSDTTACDAADASKPQCLRGDPCECDDVASNNAQPICEKATWTCPKGYTRFEDCHGVPPDPHDPVCHPGATLADASAE